MASRNIGSIYAELALKDKNFSEGLKSAAGHLKKFGGIAIGAGAAAAGAMSAALIAGTKHTMNLTDDLVDLSTQTGISIADTMKLQQAYKDGGKEAESLGRDIGRMQKSIVEASQGGSDPFKALGLSAKDLLAMNPAKQFELIAAAIMRVQNVAERNTMLRDVFGKEGIGLVSVLPELANAEKILGRMPELAQRYGNAIAKSNDLMQHLPIKSEQFFMGFTSGIISELIPGLEKIDNWDFTQMGENLGQSLAMGFSMLTDGTLFNLSRMEFVKMGMALEDVIWDAFGATDKLKENAELRNFIEGQKSAAFAGIAAKFGTARAAIASGDSNRFGPIPTMEEPTMPEVIEAPTVHIKAPEKIDVNDYQRRGLALDGSGNTVATDTKKMVEITAEIKATLTRMVNANPPATW